MDTWTVERRDVFNTTPLLQFFNEIGENRKHVQSFHLIYDRNDTISIYYGFGMNKFAAMGLCVYSPTNCVIKSWYFHAPFGENVVVARLVGWQTTSMEMLVALFTTARIYPEYITLELYNMRITDVVDIRVKFTTSEGLTHGKSVVSNLIAEGFAPSTYQFLTAEYEEVYDDDMGEISALNEYDEFENLLQLEEPEARIELIEAKELQNLELELDELEIFRDELDAKIMYVKKQIQKGKPKLTTEQKMARDKTEVAQGLGVPLRNCKFLTGNLGQSLLRMGIRCKCLKDEASFCEYNTCPCMKIGKPCNVACEGHSTIIHPNQRCPNINIISPLNN